MDGLFEFSNLICSEPINQGSPSKHPQITDYKYDCAGQNIDNAWNAFKSIEFACPTGYLLRFAPILKNGYFAYYYECAEQTQGSNSNQNPVIFVDRIIKKIPWWV